MRCLGVLLLVSSTLLITTSTSVEQTSFRRNLARNKNELAEIEREDNALEAYHLQQATLNKEQENLLHFGSEQAATVVRKFNKGNKKTQVRLFADLWENAEGITIVKALSMLFDISPDRENYLYTIINESLELAEDNGYGFKVSEALYNAMAVRDASQDHYHLLDALIYRMKDKNADEKGSGCKYIQFLFSDAEIWALDDGRGQQFFQGFDNKDYLPLVECFLPKCTGSAARCCANTKAVSTGLCGCKVINKKKGTIQCEHNLYWTAPRTIWLCGHPSCEVNEKCLCPKSGTFNKKKSKNKASKKNNKKESTEETNKKSKKKKSDKKSEKEEKKNKKTSKKSSSKGKSKAAKKSNKSKGNKKES
eukprot:g4846.t1